jgi:hypothetical protein
MDGHCGDAHPLKVLHIQELLPQWLRWLDGDLML